MYRKYPSHWLESVRYTSELLLLCMQSRDSSAQTAEFWARWGTTSVEWALQASFWRTSRLTKIQALCRTSLPLVSATLHNCQWRYCKEHSHYRVFYKKLYTLSLVEFSRHIHIVYGSKTLQATNIQYVYGLTLTVFFEYTYCIRPDFSIDRIYTVCIRLAQSVFGSYTYCIRLDFSIERSVYNFFQI